MYVNFQKSNEGEDELRIDPWDTWSLDHTLAKIIAPCLRQLRDTTHGAPLVFNVDVPEELHGPESHDAAYNDKHWFDRWDYVLNEMIFAFEAVLDENSLDLWAENEEAYEAWQARKENGLRLFGKYYEGLWD